MRDLYLVSLKRLGTWYPIIAFDEEDKALCYIANNKDNSEYFIDLIMFDPTY